ncbi:MAG: hypothetical protein ALECFALPRED_006761 [Alectoria fallacina]|uniref:Uncharacterized protein n=1 Tax=Alectoria fallacina TaxID=1903189 RepID=A0A8H3IQ82_9LECA|nr:MAG: hypothetical protein ALECFALPRED_006761 [Alectoria fallacina]
MAVLLDSRSGTEEERGGEVAERMVSGYKDATLLLIQGLEGVEEDLSVLAVDASSEGAKAQVEWKLRDLGFDM